MIEQPPEDVLVFPMSYSQQRFWFLDQLQPGTALYVIPAAVRISGSLDTAGLERAINVIVERHESLRTTFELVDDQPSQVIQSSSWVPLSIVPSHSEGDITSRSLSLCRSFDLLRGPLVRAELLRFAPNDHVLVLALHHIVSDGWSMQLFIREVAAAYAASGPLEPLPLQYADFALWQRDWLTGDVRQRQLEFWKNQLAGAPALIELPADRPRPSVQTFAGSRYASQIPPDLRASIKLISRQAGATEFMTILAAFQLLLARLSNQWDIVVGCPFANRNRQEIEPLIGLFVNTLALRGRPDPSQSFHEFLSTTCQTILDAQQHQDLPFEMLVDELRPERNLSQSPVFQVMLAWENTRDSAAVDLASLRMTTLEIDYGTAKFDLTLFVEDSPTGLKLLWEYSTDLFDADTIARIAGYFNVLLHSIATDPLRSVGLLPILPDQERNQLLVEWNDTSAPYSERAFHQLFEEQVKRSPDAIAVRGNNGAILTYTALNQRANQLAHHLIATGIGSESLVGLYCERSFELMVAVLGVLKAGAAYIPLDASYPQQRLSFMLGDANASLILTQEKLAARLPDGLSHLCLDTDWIAIATRSSHNPDLPTSPDDLAYVLYTSGSTGKPKGAEILQRGLTNYLTWAVQAYDVELGEGAPLHSSISFDATITSWFTPILVGKSVTLVEEGNEIEALAALLQSEKNFSLIKITPAHLDALSHLLPEGAAATSARAFVIGGEALFGKHLSFWHRNAPCTRMINEYGPTETVVGCCVYQAPAGADPGAIPIGRPIANTTLYVLDNCLQPVPLGVPGELFIGGAGVARGYRNRPDLTAAKFIANPFGPGRLYRTGDLVRYLPDGNLVYLGRLDDQVKIRGFRVELGEIEACLTQHAAIRDAVVVVDEQHGHKRLVAYIVPHGQVPSTADLRAFITVSLPDYMIPAVFVPLEEMPLTPNGKVDRRALPAPGPASGTSQTAPETAAEQILALIWRDVLHVAELGVHDNFFELGGDSIMSIQVISRARQAGLHLTPRHIFQHQTISALAAASTTDTVSTTVDQGLVEGDVPFTPIQQWFFAQNQPEPHHYNQSLILKVAPETSQQLVELALQRVVLHHDALRLRFANGRQFHTPPAVPLTASSQSSLNLETGPLICLNRLSPHRLLIAVQHLVIDGFSWRVLLEDLATAYGQLHGNDAVRLPAKTSSFQSWAGALVNSRSQFESELPYWTQICASTPALPPAAKNTVASTARVSLALTPEETSALLRDAPAAYHTQINDLLLTALAVASGPQTIDLESHGREPLFDSLDLSRTVGWFTAIYPVRLATPSADLAETILSIKNQLRRVPNGGIGYLILRHPGNHPELKTNSRIKFNYLGRADELFAANALIAGLAPESSDDDQSPLNLRSHPFEVTAVILDGKLQIAWEFSRNLHRHEDVELLAMRYVDALRTVITHCTSAPGEIEDQYALSPMQQGMLFETLLAPQSGVYVEQMSIRLEGNLETSRFEAAWNKVIAANGALRAEFRWQNRNEPVQIVRSSVDPFWSREDWRNLPSATRKSQLDTWIHSERHRGFDLNTAPLMRFALIQLGGNVWQFVWTYHHLLLDGWSRHRVVKAVVDAYAGNTAVPQPLPYRLYVEWLLRQDRYRAESFWRKVLQGFSASTPLTLDSGAKTSAVGIPARVQCSLSEPATARLQQTARAGRLTLNTFVQGAWALLLSRYSGLNDIVFGATVSGRPPELSGVEEMIGLFINTIPVRVSIDETGPLLPWLATLQQQQMESVEFAYCPLVDLHTWSDVPRGLPLFESIVVFENYPAADLEISAAGLTVSQAEAFEQTNYPLVLIAASGESLHLEIEYDTARFDPVAMRHMGGHLQTLLEAMAKFSPGNTLEKLPLLTIAESSHLMATLHGPVVNYPQAHGKCAHHLFEEQTVRTPDSIAIVFRGQAITYAELDRRANQLAHYLVRHGAGPECIVGVVVERSIDMIVAVLGVWKAGAAYVPLDPTYPKERLEFMIEDSHAHILLTQAKWTVSLPAAVPTICVDNWSVFAGESGEAPITNVQPGNLAYLLYTSGSTGKPKGVLIEHQSCVDHCCTVIDLHQHGPDSRVLLFVPLSFDQSVEDIFPTLLSGARLILPRPGAPPSISELLALIEAEGVTMLHMPTAYWHEWTAVLEHFPPPPCLTKVKVGGEVAPLEAYRVWKSKAPAHVAFANGYGPTETTVTSHMYHSWDALDPSAKSVPIGRTLANSLTYVLDTKFRPLPTGIPGELYIGGTRVGRGYKDRPQLTAERFIDNPFGAGRLYKTGDHVRCLQDGSLEFLGRIDQQVKIRGFRIEPGEIEALLNQHPDVRIAVVATRTIQNAAGLVAYVCPLGQPVPDHALSSFLAEHLPEYMIPAAYVWLDSMPVNPSGKIDRHALPDPESISLTRPSAPPRDPLEQQMVSIWTEVLSHPVGIHDDFFDLGGHSLLALRLVARMEQAIGFQLPLATFFEAPTVAGIAARLRSNGGDRSQWSPLVPIQPLGAARPFFCIHGGGGNVLHYYALSKALGREQPFYALQSIGLDGECEPLRSIESMAARYIEQIRRVQPEGPYGLGGHSLGGQIAYEMARQLTQVGQEVAHLVVMDTFAPGGKAAPIGADWDDARWMLELIDTIEQFLGIQLGVEHATLANLGVESQIELVAAKLHLVNAIPPGAGVGMLRGLFRVFQANNQTDYQPPAPLQLAVPITLFRGTESGDSGVKPELRADPAWGWGACSTMPVGLHFVSGDHIGMMTEPHVRMLGVHLKELLEAPQIISQTL